MARGTTPTIELDAEEILADSPDVKDEKVESQETTTEEASTEEKKETEVAEPVADGEPDAEEESEEKSEDEPEAKEEPKVEDKPQSRADERKDQVNTEIRDLVSQRNALRQEVEKLNSQVYQPQTVDQLVSEGMSEAEARIAAMEQKIELTDYNNRVAEAQLVINSESQRVLQDFPIFDPESPTYSEKLAASTAEILRSNLIIDPNTNQVIGSNVSPYQLYKTIAEATQVNAVDNQIQGQKATEKMLASVDAESSAPPKVAKEDPFLVGLTKHF